MKRAPITAKYFISALPFTKVWFGPRGVISV